MKVTKTSTIYEDIMSVVLNSTEPDRNLKKIMSLSFYFCREHVTRGAIEVRYAKNKEEMSDALAKGLDSTDFHHCFMTFMVN